MIHEQWSIRLQVLFKPKDLKEKNYKLVNNDEFACIKYVGLIRNDFHYGEEQNETEILLFIFSDSEKSFDIVEEIFMIKVLKALNFEPNSNSIKWIRI